MSTATESPPTASEQSDGPGAPPAPVAVVADRPLLGALRDLVLLGAANLAALSAFGPAFGGSQYLLIGGIGIALGALTAVVAARLRWPLWSVALVTLGWFALLGPAAAGGFADFGGAVPSPVAVRDLIVDSTRGWHDLLTTVEPVGSFGGLLAIPWTVGLVAGTVSLSIARRGRRSAAWAAAVPMVVLALGVLEGTERPAWALQGAAVLVLVVLWGSLRQRAERVGDARSGTGVRWLGAVAMLAAAALIGGLASLALGSDRTVVRRTVEPPREDLVTTSPLEEFRAYRKSLGDEPIMRVESTDQLQRIRFATLDAFDGESWTVLPDSRFQRTGARPVTPPNSEPLRTEIEILALDSRLVPTPNGQVTQIELVSSDPGRESTLEEGLRYSPSTGSFADVTPLRSGDTISAEWVPPPDPVTAGTPARTPSPGAVVTRGIPLPEDVAAASGARIDGASPLERLRSYQRLLTDADAATPE
ncbi:MAG: DUF3488 domain-containing protein, partial [Microthrixaceae bacterium]